MAIGDLDDGTRFGLPAIGLPQANLGTQGSDTERRAFPGMATKGSVFAWTGTPAMPTLLVRTGVTGHVVETVNLRVNTATGGVSVDVPTWSAGCVIGIQRLAVSLGTSTYFSWQVNPLITNNAVPLFCRERNTVHLNGVGDFDQLVVPFFDEPIFTFDYVTNGTGTATSAIALLGFVRNV